MKTPMTVEGAESLRAELTRLMTKERPALSKAVGEAASHGDLTENADYQAARHNQGLVEARIRHLQAKLVTAEIIDVSKLQPTGTVVFGATVTLLDQQDGGTLTTYRIVGEDEADVGKGTLSLKAPLARALIGQKEGAEVHVETPAGDRLYTIDSIRLTGPAE